MTATAFPTVSRGRPSGWTGSRVGLLMAAVMMLAACPGATVPPAPSVAPALPAFPSAAATAARPKPAPLPPRSPAAGTKNASETIPLLVGLSRDEARTMLGTPASATEEASAIVWRYAENDCQLRVFFFMDVTAHDFRALSYDASSSHTAVTGPDPDASARCLTRLAARKGD